MTKNARLAVVLFSCAAGVPLDAATHTMTGIVSDTTCGATHRTADAAACTRDCVTKGAGYALVVNRDVYTLKAGTSQAEKLAKRVGKTVVVRGDVDEMTVTVASVKTPKKISKH